MATDDERREVARRLREIRPCKSGHNEWWRIAQALGLKESAGWFGWEKFEPDSVNRLADLIEPSCDQERLLAIATMMAADSVRSAKQGSSVSPVYILHAARDIAEACGETFGSIRNRELAKWGTSIVPKETGIDRGGAAGAAGPGGGAAGRAGAGVSNAAPPSQEPNNSSILENDEYRVVVERK